MAIIQYLGWRQDEELKASFGYVIELKLAWAVRNFVEQIKEANSKGGHAVAGLCLLCGSFFHPLRPLTDRKEKG